MITFSIHQYNFNIFEDVRKNTVIYTDNKNVCQWFTEIKVKNYETTFLDTESLSMIPSIIIFM